MNFCGENVRIISTIIFCIAAVFLFFVQVSVTEDEQSFAVGLKPAWAGSCGSISNNDLRYYCQSNCGSISNNDLRYYCQGNYGSISNNNLRYYGQGNCGSISNNDLRYLCRSGRKYPGSF